MNDSKRLKLPRQLIDQLGIKDIPQARRPRSSIQPRKERRKSARVDKRARVAEVRTLRKQQLHQVPARKLNADRSQARALPAPITEDAFESSSLSAEVDDAEAAVDSSEQSEDEVEPPSKRPRISRTIQTKLDEDDLEIRMLEKKLGVKSKKRSTKAGAEDDFGAILDGIGDDDSTGSVSLEDGEAQEWLRKKRDASRRQQEAQQIDDLDVSDFSGFEESEQEDDNASATSTSDVMDVGLDDQPQVKSKLPSRKQARENPYRPPVPENTISANADGAMKRRVLGQEEVSDQLKRKVKGLLNRLSEANILSILTEVESLYRDNARQHVSGALMNSLLSHFDIKGSLEDTFVILHSAFIAGLFKTIGPEFGAEIVKRSTERLEDHLQPIFEESAGKATANLMALLTELFNFNVITSDLVYDFVRKFVNDVSEQNTELLLRVVKASGPQLRQEDPRALKDIVLTLQSTASKLGLSNLSVRTRFMVDTIMDLKNNRLKASLQASGLAMEHRTRLKKSLGSIPQHKTRTTEPLRINLADIHNSESRGKWWVVGARYNEAEQKSIAAETRSDNRAEAFELDEADVEIVTLAKMQRMNTEVRRSIFTSIMSATDYKDAHDRITKLRLKKSQQPEISKVLVQCVTGEQTYNPYYAFIAAKICEDRRMRMSFQFTLWDSIKALEQSQDDDTSFEEVDNVLDVKAVVHLGKMYGQLVAENKLDIKIVKNIDTEEIEEGEARHVFLEVFLVTLILQCHRKKSEEAEELMRQIFGAAKELPDFGGGLGRFVGSTVKQTDFVAKKSQRKALQAGCAFLETVLGDGEGADMSSTEDVD